MSESEVELDTMESYPDRHDASPGEKASPPAAQRMSLAKMMLTGIHFFLTFYAAVIATIYLFDMAGVFQSSAQAPTQDGNASRGFESESESESGESESDAAGVTVVQSVLRELVSEPNAVPWDAIYDAGDDLATQLNSKDYALSLLAGNDAPQPYLWVDAQVMPRSTTSAFLATATVKLEADDERASFNHYWKVERWTLSEYGRFYRNQEGYTPALCEDETGPWGGAELAEGESSGEDTVLVCNALGKGKHERSQTRLFSRDDITSLVGVVSPGDKLYFRLQWGFPACSPLSSSNSRPEQGCERAWVGDEHGLNVVRALEPVYIDASQGASSMLVTEMAGTAAVRDLYPLYGPVPP